MAENWVADVRRYAADADEDVVGAIVRYCGVALRDEDSSLVSFSDKAETDRVRENYLKKKLGLTQDDATLDSAVASIGERMQADRNKNRVTIYYLLADHFGALDVFGGTARAAQPASPELTRMAPMVTAAPPPPASRIPVAAPAMAVGGRPASGARTGYWASGDAGIIGNISWGVLASVVGGVLVAGFLALGLRAMKHPPLPMLADRTAQTVPAAMQVAPALAAPLPPPPEGAGVIAAEREARPMLTVYFDVGKAEVTNKIAAAAAAVTAYLEAHSGTTLAVSGFNDPTGNAAANAELSKNRAQNVKAALEATGIPADKVLLEKPAETTGTSATNTESRRVEVVVVE